MKSPRASPALQKPPPLKFFDKANGLRFPSAVDPVLSPRTPPPCRALPWSPNPTQQVTPLASWGEVAKVQSQGADWGKFQTPTGRRAPPSAAPTRGTPQPRVPWSYIASPSSDLGDGSPAAPAEPAAGALASEAGALGTLPIEAGGAFDWAPHPELTPGGIFPWSLDAGFPWQVQDAQATPPPPLRTGLSPSPPRTPGSSPFRLRSRLSSPPRVGPQGHSRRRSPSSSGLSDGPLRELMEDAEPNSGRFLRDFGDIAPVATGQFSAVYSARHKTDGHLYAVKVQASSAPGDRQAPRREVFALASVAAAGAACPNLVRYFSSWQEEDRMHIQIELCESTLRSSMKRQLNERPHDPRFGDDELVGVFRQVANGLATLHRLGFAHLDVKPDNILLGRDGCFKLGDLGLATLTSDERCGPVPEGDCRYLARELLQGTFDDLTKADVFSLGVVCYELGTNPKELPQNGDEWQALRDGSIDAPSVPHLSSDVLRLVRAMVNGMPSERPGCAELADYGRAPPASELEALRRELREAREAAARGRELAETYQKELTAARQQLQFRVASLGG